MKSTIEDGTIERETVVRESGIGAASTTVTKLGREREIIITLSHYHTHTITHTHHGN